MLAGQGTYEVVDGRVRFTPADGFVGTAAAVTYEVRDANGTPARAEVQVTVEGPGQAVPDRDSTRPGSPVTVDVLDNDLAAEGETLVPDSVCLLPRGADGPCVKKYTDPDVGTWVVGDDGRITFTPVDDFRGVAVIEYAVTDTAGNVYVTELVIDVDGGLGGIIGGLLPDAGGPALVLLLLGLLAAGGGAVLVRRRGREGAGV